MTGDVRSLLLLIGLILSLVALGLAIGLIVRRARRLRRLTRAARQLARGDLTPEIDDAGRDEVAGMARSLNRCRARLAQQRQVIDRQRDVLASLLGRLGEGVIVSRRDGRIVLLNAEASRLLKVPQRRWSDPAQPAAMTVEECIPQHDLQRLLLVDAEAESAPPGANPADANRSTAEAQFELQGPGGTITVLARASDIQLPDPADVGVGPGTGPAGPARLLLLTDVTDMAKAMKMRSDFVANASHELRTPLSAVRGAVQTLLSLNLRDEADAADRFLKMIERHTLRLEAMVADLLELSRLEAPSRKLVPAALPVRRVSDGLRDRWAEALASRNLRWKTDLDPQAPTVFANAHLLEVVLDNLVENAIKFTEPGGEVRLIVAPAGDEVAITVADEGCGIPRADHERVFERFYQVAQSRAATDSPENRGTGLGLSIVRHAVAAMGGRVHLESEVGRGTRVRITIPKGTTVATP